MKEKRKISKYSIRRNFDGTEVVFNTKTGKVLSFDSTDKIDDAINQNSDLFQLLAEYKFIVHDDEYNQILEGYKKIQNETLFLIILAHENCNFRCKYCYEKFEKNELKDDIVSGIKKYVENQLSTGVFKNLVIEWFGGEPLLSASKIINLSSFFKKTADKYGVVYSASMTTNGYLLSLDTFDKLLEFGVQSFQITVDGTKKMHDEQRVLANGKGTYDKIMNNLLQLHETDKKFDIMIRVNVGEDNKNTIADFISDVKKLFEQDSRFSMIFRNIGKWSENNDMKLCEDIGLYFTKTAEKIGVQTKYFSYLMPYITCYGGRRNSYVIGSDGNIYKCTVYLYEKENAIGKLSSDGTMQLDKAKLNMWNDQSQAKTDTCRSCSILPQCMGNLCPAKRIFNHQNGLTFYCKNKPREILNSLEIKNNSNLFDIVIKGKKKGNNA